MYRSNSFKNRQTPVQSLRYSCFMLIDRERERERQTDRREKARKCTKIPVFLDTTP